MQIPVYRSKLITCYLMMVNPDTASSVCSRKTKMKIFDLLSGTKRVVVFMLGLNSQSEQSCDPAPLVVQGDSVVRNFKKEGSRISVGMQREAFQKGGFVRLTVDGNVEFVPCVGIVAKRIEETVNALVEVMDAFLRPTSTVKIVNQEVKPKTQRPNEDRNGIRFI